MFIQIENNKWIKTFEKIRMLAEITQIDVDNFLITFFIQPNNRGFADKIRQRKAGSLAEADIFISEMAFRITEENKNE